MKRLQDNFTTPEQSKRLLELGVPVDSADMYYKHTMLPPYVLINKVLFSVYSDVEDVTPCWSVGRLREIFCICSSVNGTREYPFCNGQVAWWITEFEFKKEFIDFSKLKDWI